MPPLVRRARKNIRERRMKKLQRELVQNLEKVEKRTFAHLSKVRASKRKNTGQELPPVPAAVLQGKMNPELYHIECRLYEEAGLPLPLPYEGYDAEEAKQLTNRRVGFLPFSLLINEVRKMNAASARRSHQ